MLIIILGLKQQYCVKVFYLLSSSQTFLSFVLSNSFSLDIFFPHSFSVQSLSLSRRIFPSPSSLNDSNIKKNTAHARDEPVLHVLYLQSLCYQQCLTERHQLFYICAKDDKAGDKHKIVVFAPTRRFPKSYQATVWYISAWCAVCPINLRKLAKWRMEVAGQKNPLQQISSMWKSRK